MRRLLQIVLVASLLSTLASCRFFYPNLMFKQKDYEFFELARKKIEHYVVQPGDQFTLRVYSRDGFKLVDVLGNASVAYTGVNYSSMTAGSDVAGSGTSGMGVNAAGGNTAGGGGPTAQGAYNVVTYLVDNEGFAHVPVLGEIFVKGFSEAELERSLAEKYSNLFVDPFVMVKVINRRALVFKGSAASVVPLNEAPTHLLEVIAKAGGLDQNLKAYRIKVIRGDLSNPQIQLVDLSTLEGVRQADLIVQSNDIIYIEEKKRIGADIMHELAPYIALASTVASLIIVSTRFGN